MRRSHRWWLGLLLLTAMHLPAAELRIVAYVPTWSDLARLTTAIPFARLTHLDIAFVNATDDAGTLEAPAKVAPLIAAAHQHGLRVMVSLGGGSASEDRVQRERYAALMAPARRAGFISGITRYLRTHGYDGIDIDLEGPAISADYGGFIADLATTLQAEHQLLSAALSSGYGGDRIPAAALTHFDFINLMAYDATGPWTPDRPGPHASVELATAEIAFWRRRGVAGERIVLGVPFYGYAFNADRSVRALSFNDIVTRHPGAEQHDQVDTLFYNGFPAIRAKAALVMKEGLGGMMIWSLDQDAPGERSLLAEMARVLGR